MATDMEGSRMRFKYLMSLALLASATATIAAAQPTAPANSNPAAVTAGRYVVEPNHTRLQFSLSHMGFTHWYGDLTGASGSLVLDPKNPTAAKVEVTLPVASVSTTNAKLDEELRSPQWLDANAYPTIRFVSTRVVRTGERSATVTGDLTFHGVTRPVTLKAVFNGAGTDPIAKAYTVGFDAATTIHRSDFGVKTYVPLIGDAVDIRISAAFVPASN